LGKRLAAIKERVRSAQLPVKPGSLPGEQQPPGLQLVVRGD